MAGTGAGKTEAFLLPMLNQLANTPRQENNSGIRCLILYPMNALVNDQVDRLYGWLRGQDRIKLFHFTSETPENYRAAERDHVPHWEQCRIRTRQQARGVEDAFGKKVERTDRPNVPDIVITNYSMLEYMLCRPQDAVFFGKSLSCVILDEAHLYTVRLAGEITLLLRRLLDRCGVTPSDVLHLATSATMGGADEEIQRFAETLFSKPADRVSVIRGLTTRTMPEVQLAPPTVHPGPEGITGARWVDQPTIVRSPEGEPSLAENIAQCGSLAQNLLLLVGHSAIEAGRAISLILPACCVPRWPVRQ